ncbi:aldo/keto reductase [Nocardiopsis sp. NPDC006198]|uniref:aldo/keto reductase n=1 Tax=Nocardiopsis sp. NPDC006198 TaxID=3154472 RepID=UPI0033A5A82A
MTNPLFSSSNRIGFGSMQLTGPGYWAAPDNPEQSMQVLRDAVDAGVTHIDTVDAYGPFTAEKYIRKALHPYRDDLVIATKGGLTRQGPDRWAPCGRPCHVKLHTVPRARGDGPVGELVATMDIRCPRARGDGSSRRNECDFARPCSPRTRGWTHLDLGEGPVCSCLPAHAGMDPGPPRSRCLKSLPARSVPFAQHQSASRQGSTTGPEDAYIPLLTASRTAGRTTG